MVDIDYLGQLVDSMEEAVLRLDVAASKQDMHEVNQLRTFIFDLHRQINAALAGAKHV